MAKFTNLYGIRSKSVIDALTTDDYDLSKRPANVFSATEVIDAPKNRILHRRHDAELIIDISDNFHTMDGSAVHYVMERANKDSKRERLSEERIFICIPEKNGEVWNAFTMAEGEDLLKQPWYHPDSVYVSCKFDNYEREDECVEDYKRTSVWEAVFGLKDSRVKQLNICGYALRLLHFPVNTLRACLDLKDWSAKDLKDAERRSETTGMPCNYPPIKYKEFKAPVWSNDECAQYIIERVSLHLEALSKKDDEIEECNADERWYRGEQFAIMKAGNQRATKCVKVEDHDSRDIAWEVASTALATIKAQYPKDEKKYSIEIRPGLDGRCAGDKVYCHARQFCHYWREKYSQGVVIQGDY